MKALAAALLGCFALSGCAGLGWYSRCQAGTVRSAATGLCEKQPCWSRCAGDEECAPNDRCVPKGSLAPGGPFATGT